MIHVLLTPASMESATTNQWFAMITTNALLILVRMDNVNSHPLFAMIMMLALLILVVLKMENVNSSL